MIDAHNGSRSSLYAALIITMIAAGSVLAGSHASPRTLGWQDLIPQLTEFDDPFEELTPDELYDLRTVAQMRELKAQGSEIMTGDKVTALESLERKLIDSGINVDYLLSQRERVREARRAQAETVVEELDGKTIRMPGYALPLEFDETDVKEFLLVPFVGACIHTPPPPANQIVHVKSNKGFENESLFDPVWVTGEMSIVSSTQSLFLVDGSSDISVGYSMEASSVKPYTN